MNRTFRLKQDMGVRALGFCQAHPADTPRYGEAVSELAAAVGDGRALITRFGEGRSAAHAAKEEREVIRGEILDTLRDIVRIGVPVAVEVPSLKGYFRVGRVNASLEALLARGRQYADKVAEHQDRFTGFGFGPERLAAFNAVLDSLAAALTRGNAATDSHVGATADMSRVGNRIMYFVDVLDAINRLQFAGEPLKLAAWVAASAVSWPGTKAAREARKEKGKDEGVA